MGVFLRILVNPDNIKKNTGLHLNIILKEGGMCFTDFV